MFDCMLLLLVISVFS